MHLNNVPLVWAVFLFVAILGLSSNVHASSNFVKVPQEEYQMEQGRSLELSCVASRKDAVCVWSRNGTFTVADSHYKYLSEPKNGDCSIVIHSLQFPRDNTVFECQAVVPDGSIGAEWPKTNVVVLIKPNLPRIKENSMDYAPITADKVSSIACESEGGNPLPSLEWSLNGENITANASYEVKGKTVTSTLSYVFKKRNNATLLTCESVHPLQKQSAKQVLNVLYKPIVSVAQKMYTVLVDQKLEIDCMVDSNPPSQAIWKPTNINIANNKFKINGSKLLLPKIDSKMDGLDFQCSAQNAIGNSEPETVKLNVLYEPHLIEISDEKQEIALGKELRLECKWSGNPKPQILWYFVDAIYSLEHLPTPSPDNPGLLIIKNISYTNEGDYYCEAISENPIKDNVARVRSRKIAVNVLGKPQFLNSKETVVGYQGSTTIIEQVFCSDPAPTSVQWSWDGSVQHNVDVNWKNKKDDPMFANPDEVAHISAGSLVPLDPKSPNPTCFKAALLVSNTDMADTKDFILLVRNGDSETNVEGVVSLQVYNKMSGAMIISISLILLIMFFLLTVIFILFLRRRTASNKRDADCEDKSDARVPINDSTDAKKSNEK